MKIGATTAHATSLLLQFQVPFVFYLVGEMSPASESQKPISMLDALHETIEECQFTVFANRIGI